MDREKRKYANQSWCHFSERNFLLLLDFLSLYIFFVQMVIDQAAFPLYLDPPLVYQVNIWVSVDLSPFPLQYCASHFKTMCENSS